MRKTTWIATALLLGSSLSVVPFVSHAQGKQQNEPRQNLIREVRHQLVLLPYYSVFDNLAFRVGRRHHNTGRASGSADA